MWGRMHGLYRAEVQSFWAGAGPESVGCRILNGTIVTGQRELGLLRRQCWSGGRRDFDGVHSPSEEF